MLQGTAQDTGHGVDTFVNFENLSGDQYDDTLTGDNNANFIWGENDPTTGDLVANNDTLYGLGGDDLLQVGLGDNLVDGGDGTDTASIYYTNAGVSVSLALQGAAQVTGQGSMTLFSIENLFGSPYNDTLTGDKHANVLGGDDGDDTLNGGKGDDTLYGDGSATIGGTRGFSGPIEIKPEGADAGIGASKNDTLNGGGGDDVLVGGAGSDSLDGAGGSDRFVYLDVSDSVSGSADTIHHLSNADTIDLSAIDADTTAVGDQAFTLVSHFTGTAGELTLAVDHHLHVTVLSGDVDGDGVADFVVNIDGNHAHFTNFDL
jgi:Ca2+-binding RTX toxin-like protein